MIGRLSGKFTARPLYKGCVKTGWITISGTSSLALGRKIQCFTDGHFTSVKVMLADINHRLRGDKLVMGMAIEGHQSSHFQGLIKLPC